MKSFRSASGRRGERSQHSRRWLVVFVCLAVLVASVKTCTIVTGRSNPVDRAINRAAAPLVVLVRYMGDGIASLGQVFRLPSILQEQRRLNSEVKELRRELAESEGLVARNERLERLLKVEAPRGFREVHASVTARPYDLWMENVILNKGFDDGVRQGCLVRNEDGLVGIVKETQGSYCWVELVVSPRFRLAAFTASSVGQGVIRGIDQSTLKLMYIAAGTKAKVGEYVYTARPAGAIGEAGQRPVGILIGTINDRQADQNGFLDITVAPAVNPNRISDVVVLVK